MRPIASLTALGATLLALTAPVLSQTGGQLPAAPGRPIPTPAPQWALNAFQVSAGTVQDLVIPDGRNSFRLSVVLGGRLVDIDLHPNDIRSPNFQLLVDDGNTITQWPTPESVTWRGSVAGDVDSVVAASIVGRRMDMSISLGSGEPLWGVQSLQNVDPARPISQHLVYSGANSTAQGATCGTDDSAWKASPSQPGQEVRKVCEIALDADLEYYNRNGSNVNVTQNAVTTVMNGVDAIYQRDTDTEYSITTILVRTTRTYTNTNMGNLLGEFRNRWNSQHGGIQRDVAHLFTGKGSFGGVVGIAYLGVICNLSNAYGVDKAFANNSTNIGLVSHELGHNWNAPHCDGANPCNIMCAGLGGCNRNLSRFGTSSINTIVGFKNSRGCLSDPQPSQPPVLTSLSPSSAPAFPPTQIVLRGTNMAAVTRVDIGSVQINNPNVQSDTEVRVTAPIPASLGANFVRAFNSAGGSNTLPLNYTETSPPIHAAPNIAVSNATLGFQLAGGANDNFFLLTSFNDAATFPFLGYTILTNNLVLISGTLNSVGFRQADFQVPNVSMAGVQIRTQAVMLDGTSGALDYVTNILVTTFFQ